MRSFFPLTTNLRRFFLKWTTNVKGIICIDGSGKIQKHIKIIGVIFTTNTYTYFFLPCCLQISPIQTGPVDIRAAYTFIMSLTH